MMTQRVKTAVFPVGGMGTRFLPATKSMPKEMLPVVDKPIVHYAYEEAKAAGIEQFIFVTGRNKTAIDNHFDHSYELETLLESKEKRKELGLTRDWLPNPGNIFFTRQQEPLGLGHAVWCARHLVQDEPFAVILADDMVKADAPCLKQMIEAYEGGNMTAVMDVPREKTASYGILDIESEADRIVKAHGLVEKPAPEEAPSTLSIIGRYILDPGIFEKLGKHQVGSGGEIQLTDAMASMIPDTPFHGYRFEGTRYDCGNKAGFLEANIAFALERDDMRDSVQSILDRYHRSSTQAA
jgi:UTP--glucose-1-phosphate uridylyltransferase